MLKRYVVTLEKKVEVLAESEYKAKQIAEVGNKEWQARKAIKVKFFA